MKARREGISKEIDADQLVDCIKKPTAAVIISHEKKATTRLFDSVRGFIESMRCKPTTSIESRSEIVFPRRGSTYYIGTAGAKAFSRGDGVDRAHLSEAAFYADLETILNGVAEAAEYGSIDIESTPNGRNGFYDEWQKAKRGLSSFTNIFIPWFINREYSSDNMTEKEKNGLSVKAREMLFMPDAEVIASLTAEEKKLIERVAREYGIVLTPGEIKWRRVKILDRGDFFWQEYPEDDVSCFLQSGRPVFTHIVTDETKRVELDSFESWSKKAGWDDRRKAAFKKKLLFAGLDPSEGTLTGDPHAFAVMDVDVLTGKAYVVFRMRSNEPIDIFAAKVAKITKEFNIWMGVEKNGVGVAMCRELQRLKVRFREWETGPTSRPVMITEYEQACRNEEVIETYLRAENEARDMQYIGEGTNPRPEHRPGKHDDETFAAMIAYQMRSQPRPGITYL